jgi:excisionase family DNA binding protein
VKGLASVDALVSPAVFEASNYKDRIFVCQKNYWHVAIVSRGILWRMKVIGTTEAAKRLGVSANRVRALIDSGRLKAQKIGREYAINPSDLKAVKVRKVGRPRNARKTA